MSDKERLVIENFNAFGGKHCWTTSLRNLFRFHGLDLSEEVYFGLGGGLGFVYWYMKKMLAPFIGGRQARGLDPLLKPAEWCGAKVYQSSTSSSKKGYQRLKDALRQGKPVILFVDMAYLPYYALPEEAHFGGHTIIVYGLDENEDRVYVSDRSVKPVTMTIDDLKQARASTFPPMPPKHQMFHMDYPAVKTVFREQILNSVRQCCNNMLHAPIKNLGLKGIRYWADMVLEWPELFPKERLFCCLFNTFLFIEVGGTGGSSFRPMYAQYLEEAGQILNRPGLNEVAADLRKSGVVWSEIASAALPDSWPTLKGIRELMVEKNRIFEEQGPGAYPRMVEISKKLDEYLIKERAIKEFKAVARQDVTPLLQNLREKILQLHAAEEKAFTKLNEIVSEP